MRVRKLGKIVVIMMVITFVGSIFISSSNECSQSSSSISIFNSKFPSSAQSYVVHAPIVITSDGGFASYSFSGSGIRGDPYLIEGYNITSQGAYAIGIEIRNTNLFFVINSCVIYSDWVGVHLENVAAGTSKIIGNRIISLTGDGGGVGLGSMQNCTISDNICTNFMQGIHLNYVDDCKIRENYIYDSNYQGINIRYSDSNVITFNRIKNAREHGIALVGTSSSNVIHHNTFEENTWANSYNIDGTPKGSPTSQGYDEGSQNTWYDSENQKGNTWSDYFGIGPYEIDGPVNAVDLYPQHTEGITPFVIIISSVSIVIGLAIVVAVYFIYRKKKKVN